MNGELFANFIISCVAVSDCIVCGDRHLVKRRLN